MSEQDGRQIFHRRFNELLRSRRISQKEVAAVCKVSTSTVSTWSKGINMPRMDTLERLAAFFDLPTSSLIEERTPDMALSDFTYAMQNESRDLSEKDRQILLDLARELNQSRKRRNGESG